MKGRGGGNNYPLRGGKAGNWEGGVRVNGFVAGGFVPEKMRGTKLEGLTTAWDWYATVLEGIAGLDPADKEAEAAGLPPIDSVNLWPYLSGATSTSPRTQVPMGTTADPKDIWLSKNDIVVHGMVETDGANVWKLLLGAVPQNIWTGPEFPNATSATLPPAEKLFGSCGFAPGCLFELSSDPGEHANVAAQHPTVVARLRAALEAANKTVWAPVRPKSAKACDVSLSKYKDPEHDFGWWGPFVDV